MAVRKPRYSKEEFARRGNEIYERQVRPQVEKDNQGKIVAIDIDTGEYALGENILLASRTLFDRNDDAQLWSVRVGHRAVYHIGGRSVTEKQ